MDDDRQFVHAVLRVHVHGRVPLASVKVAHISLSRFRLTTALNYPPKWSGGDRRWEVLRSVFFDL